MATDRIDPDRPDAIRRAPLDALAPRELHDILQLRSAVFVVEQACVFLDIDGRDVEAGAEQLWIRDERGIAATVRILDEGDGVWSIGRVATRRDARSGGMATRLMDEAIAVLDTRAVPAITLGAQSHLADWYRRFGFEVSGDEYLEDGIAHVPMRREVGRS